MTANLAMWVRLPLSPPYSPDRFQDPAFTGILPALLAQRIDAGVYTSAIQVLWSARILAKDEVGFRLPGVAPQLNMLPSFSGKDTSFSSL